MNIKPEEKAGDSQTGYKTRLCFVHQVVAKLVVDCSHHLRSWDPERHEEPGESLMIAIVKEDKRQVIRPE